MLSWKEWGEWLAPRAVDVEPLLERAFKGTGLLQGGVSDYLVALAVACAFPIMRYLMDRHVYGVSAAGGGAQSFMGQPSRQGPRAAAGQRELDRCWICRLPTGAGARSHV